MRRTVARALTGLLLAMPLALIEHPSHAEEPAVERQPDVIHRVVWDAALRQGPRIKLVSAELDGTDRRVIFRRARGFVTDLDLNPRGDEVAFAPFKPREGAAELVVVDVRTGERDDLLDGAHRFAVLGGIGWSPDGRRLAFEGWIDEGEERNGYLWTIRRDGSQLTRHSLLERSSGQWVGTLHLAWTRHGIYHNGVRGLMRLGPHGSQLVVRRAFGPLVSGNGRLIQVRRPDGAQHTRSWQLRGDGSDLRRTRLRNGPSSLGYIHPLGLNHSGRLMISNVSGVGGVSTDVIHDATRSPQADDRSLDFLDGAYVVDWN